MGPAAKVVRTRANREPSVSSRATLTMPRAAGKKGRSGENALGDPATAFRSVATSARVSPGVAVMATHQVVAGSRPVVSSRRTAAAPGILGSFR